MSDPVRDPGSVPPQVAELARAARRISVLTGAGMSAESGVPTFREAQDSLWARYDPMTLATPEAFAEDPDLVWGWYLRRAQQIAAVEPNAGHRALGEWGRRLPLSVTTQNVDDLHERGGSRDVNHLHGSITAYRCSACAEPYDAPVALPGAEAPVAERVQPPACPACGAPIRPGIVWFGEMLPEGAIDRAIEDGMASDLLLVVGTSGVVYPAAGVPDFVRGAGVPVVEINPVATDLSDRVDVTWRTTAAVGLPALLAALG